MSTLPENTSALNNRTPAHNHKNVLISLENRENNVKQPKWFTGKVSELRAFSIAVACYYQLIPRKVRQHEL